MLRKGLFVFLFVTVLAVPAPARELSPGAQRTLAAARSMIDYADPFQEKFDQICSPVYAHAASLHGVERENYMLEADKKISKKLAPMRLLVAWHKKPI